MRRPSVFSPRLARKASNGPITPPTEFILSKLFLQDRYRYDGADVAHVILKKHEEVDWHRLLNAMELYWEVLLIQILNFRFIYPTKRDLIPRWAFDELGWEWGGDWVHARDHHHIVWARR